MMEPETFDEPGQEETVKAKNFFSRLSGVFFSPREAFTEIGSASRLAIPIIALFLVSALSGWYVAQKIDTRAASRAALDEYVRQGRITEEQANQQAAMAAVALGPAAAVVGGIGTLLLCLAIAGYGKLFSVMTGRENSYKSLFEVTVYGMLAVGIVSAVLMIIILQIKGQGRIAASDINAVVASNLGAWIDSAFGADVLPKFVMRLAAAVNIFNIWIIALLSIGFSAVSKKMKTSTPAIWLGGAYVIISVISAAITSVFSA